MAEFRRLRHKWAFYSVFITAHAQNSHISASDLRTFSVVFHRKSNKSAIFLLTVYLTYWRRKRATCWATHIDHFHQVWSWYDYPSSSHSVFSADTSIDLATSTFDLLTLDSVQAWRVAWATPSTKFVDPTPIRSWLMSYDVRHKPPLTMRLEPLRMRRIAWPVRRGPIFPKYLKSLTPICLFTMQLRRLYDQDKLSYLPKLCTALC